MSSAYIAFFQEIQYMPKTLSVFQHWVPFGLVPNETINVNDCKIKASYYEII